MGVQPKPLAPGYEAQIDAVTEVEWSGILARFADANIYQTWFYDAVRFGDKNISHVVLRSGGAIVAAAQARLSRLPVIGLGAAYVRWAPLWRLRDGAADPRVLGQALRALRNEYVCRRGLILRIFPLLYDDGESAWAEILLDEEYTSVPKERAGRTLIMDISPPLDELRKKLDQKWRNCLNRAERNYLEVIDGTDDDLFVEFIELYRAMLGRKRFEEPNDINEFRSIQKDLPSCQKMRVFLARSGGVSSSGAVCGMVGDTGLYLFGATNSEALANKGSYLVQWKAIQSMKDYGIRYYNLNGINPENNPGGYHFKVGLMGKNGRDLCYLGRYDSYPGEWNARLARAADVLLPNMRKTIKRLRSLGR